MGAAPSVLNSGKQELGAPLDGSDLRDFEAAQQEVTRLRKLIQDAMSQQEGFDVERNKPVIPPPEETTVDLKLQWGGDTPISPRGFVTARMLRSKDPDPKMLSMKEKIRNLKLALSSTAGRKKTRLSSALRLSMHATALSEKLATDILMKRFEKEEYLEKVLGDHSATLPPRVVPSSGCPPPIPARLRAPLSS